MSQWSTAGRAILAGLQSAWFMSPRDIGLFLRSARTDTAIARGRGANGDPEAFDAVYARGDGDPWSSGDSRYRYQSHKYNVLTGLLPARRFGAVIDLGAGHGLFGRRVADRAKSVLGVDISGEAVRRAEHLHAGQANMRFEQGDIRAMRPGWAGQFDLVLLADTIYYLPPPLSDTTLREMADAVSALLAPGGICLLANHFFFAADPDSRLSRRVHRAFSASTGFRVLSEHRRPFYIVSILEKLLPG